MDWFPVNRDLRHDRVEIANSQESQTFSSVSKYIVIFREHKQNKIQGLYIVEQMYICQDTYMLC